MKGSIVIKQVSNGYIIEPDIHQHRDLGSAMNLNEVLVFNTLEVMFSYLTHHFEEDEE